MLLPLPNSGCRYESSLLGQTQLGKYLFYAGSICFWSRFKETCRNTKFKLFQQTKACLMNICLELFLHGCKFHLFVSCINVKPACLTVFFPNLCKILSYSIHHPPAFGLSPDLELVLEANHLYIQDSDSNKKSKQVYPWYMVLILGVYLYIL